MRCVMSVHGLVYVGASAQWWDSFFMSFNFLIGHCNVLWANGSNGFYLLMFVLDYFCIINYLNIILIILTKSCNVLWYYE